jgi:thiol-disulfide isomerase/thioredoxin
LAESKPSNLNLSVLDQFQIYPIQVDDKLVAQSAKPIKLSELYKGKWVILDISATWCPYCKLDQIFFSAQRNTLNEYSVNKKLWSKDVVQVHMNIEYQAKGAREQTQDSIRKFLSPESLAQDKNLKGLNRSHMDSFLMSKMDREAIKTVTTKSGQLIFKDFQGYPYQMVFDPKGQLVFQGNFTSRLAADGDDWSKPYRRHYKMLSRLIETK